MILQVGVKALVVNSRDEYLFIRRTELLSTDNTAEVSWDIPGGRIKPEEPLLDALRREIKEEVGHDMTSTPQLIAAQDIFVAAKELHVVRLTYTLHEDVSDVELSDEHQEHIWVHRSKIGAVNTEPYLAAVLKDLSLT